MTTPELQQIRLGCVALTDALPLVVAQRLGFFRDQGVQAVLSWEASWSNIRDKVIVGHLDAAQMLAPMPLAATIGAGGLAKPMLTACVLNLNGNAITVSADLFAELVEAADGDGALAAARALAVVTAKRRSEGASVPVFATVFPFSTHSYQLRYWLAAGGLDPDRDIKLVVLPPTQMVDNLRMGHIDGFCVGEPWNAQAVAIGAGKCVVTGYEIWQNAPEKVLGVTADWASRYPRTHAALIRAVWHAGLWLQENLEQGLALLDGEMALPVTREVLQMAPYGELPVGFEQRPRPAEQFHVFHRFHANFPWRSSAVWFVEQMQRWGQAEAGVEPASLAEQVWRTDIYREVLSGMALAPPADYKPEGSHREPWILGDGDDAVALGPDRFIGQRDQ